ncbi:unnamed protein product [Bursaphelenchus xylophilus]|uniref:(pine wood nematode) hypothetical protein n=1 Tax=Bursaphelenchus xylophilus TaxID=6326 RepID=A0A1I7RZQ5_BURXY|nr:unnamed protein product [Bursaphelenchus xylophilus]CAG9111554.1 unnamed protein product [Bursaphelenchus xylophilus]
MMQKLAIVFVLAVLGVEAKECVANETTGTVVFGVNLRGTLIINTTSNANISVDPEADYVGVPVKVFAIFQKEFDDDLPIREFFNKRTLYLNITIEGESFGANSIHGITLNTTEGDQWFFGKPIGNEICRILRAKTDRPSQAN